MERYKIIYGTYITGRGDSVDSFEGDYASLEEAESAAYESAWEYHVADFIPDEEDEDYEYELNQLEDRLVSRAELLNPGN